MEDDGRPGRKESRRSRRRRLRNALSVLRRRLKRFCETIEQVDGLLGRVSDVAGEMRSFVSDAEVTAMVPGKARGRLEEAVESLEAAKERTAELVDA